MSHRHRSPKRFRPPRSYRGREHASQVALGVSDSEIYAAILKHAYPAGGGALQRPAWATDARDRHWMTYAEWVRLPMSDWVEGPPGIYEFLYEESPFFSLIKKDETFGAVGAIGATA